MDQIVSYILFSQCMALLICSALQLTVKARSRVNTLMALLFFLLSYILFYFWSYRTGVIFALPFMLHSDLAVTFMTGPALYAYVSSMTGENDEFSLKNVIPYIPAFLVFCFFILYNAAGNAPAEHSEAMFPDYHSDVPVYIFSILADIWFFIYVFLVVKKTYSFMHTEKFRDIREIRIICYLLTGVAVSSLLLFPAHLLKNDILIGIVAITNGSFGVLYFLFSYRHPEYTQMVIKGPRVNRSPATLPDAVDLPGIMENLTALMEKEHIYRNAGISLQTLSNLLGIKSANLSLVLNEKLGVNFRTFINRYRLDEAKKLLVENRGKSIIEIAFLVGFNSKSAFNTIFAKTTGHTPTEFRKKFP